MDIEYNFDLSAKSKGILYKLKSSLAKNNLDLANLVGHVFQYHKTKFNRKQFHVLIKQYDNNLIMEDIDELFQGLDDSKNDVVFFESFVEALKLITEDDNPTQSLNRKSMIRFRQNNNTDQKQTMDILIQVKDLLLLSEDYLEVICLFVPEKDRFLTKKSVLEILRSFQYEDQRKQNIFLKQIFKNKQKLQIKEFLQKLGLQSIGTRINLQISPEKKSNNKMQIQDDQKSQYIKNQEKSIIKHPSMKQNQKKVNDLINSFRNNQLSSSQHFSIENIPPVLQHYFNYGSQLQEPFASFASQYISKSMIFIDEQNPTYSKAHGWVHIVEVKPNYQLFQMAKSIIKRDNNRKGLRSLLEPKDIIQGSFGDCYFLSAVAAIVQDYPELVYNLFVLQKNPSHIFGVKLFIDGKWITIALDGSFPVYGYGRFCGAQPHYNEIWVMLLQKAWAKIYKSYENIYAGYNEQGLLAISGAPSVRVSTKQKNYIRKIMAQFGKGSIITCATSRDVSQLTEAEQQNLGVFAGHAYTLLKVYQKLKYNNSQVTLFKIRNPWGKKGWKGDWSFKSSKWTYQLRQKLNFVNDSQDGTFFISLDDFSVYFDYINISKVNLGYRHSYVSNKSSRFDFYQNRFRIEQKGDYFFTLYQQNGRKYKNTSQIYQKSKNILFLAKIKSKTSSNQINDLTSIACCTSFNNNTIQTTLEPGQYVLFSKVSWKYWNQHVYTLTSYGPCKINFKPGVIAPPQLISKFIESRAHQLAQHDAGKVKIYDGYNASNRCYFNHHQGIGFIILTNYDVKALETTIYMDPCKGILILPPFNLPLKLFIMPYQIKTVSFLVDPEGYNYNLREKYNMRNVG